MFDIRKLIPTHNKLRCDSAFYFFKNQDVNDCWSREEPIVIIKTPDGLYYLWDGHHQVCAAYDNEITFIPDGLYKIYEKTYEQVDSINFRVGFVTPFSLKDECRFPNFLDFKQEVLDLYKYSEPYTKHIEHYIRLSASKYKEKRVVHSIKELINESGLSEGK